MISTSVVICTYNQKDILARALESLKRQIKNPREFEIVIVDDCSNDGTDQFIRKLRVPVFLKYVRNETNLGVAHNRNRGFQKAAGRWVIFIDGDMEPTSEFLDAYVRAWAEFPDGVCVGSYDLPPDWTIQRWQRYLMTRGRLAMPHGVRVPGRYFTSGNFSAPRDILAAMAGFDQEFSGWGGDDTDLGLRMEERGVPIYNVPDAHCYHHDAKKLDYVVKQYVTFGRVVYPLLLKKHPGKIIFKNGWLLGLPDSQSTLSRRLAATLLAPLRTGPSLAALRILARFRGGALFSDKLFDWLFYGHLASGFRESRR